MDNADLTRLALQRITQIYQWCYRPSERAMSEAARSAIMGVAIKWNSLLGRLPGFGVSSASWRSRAAMAGDGTMP